MFNLRSLDLNLLTVFEAIFELGTVSAAADRLALSQSATSHALSRLREACRDDLFVRARNGLSPTPVAEAMYPAIKHALDALRASLKGTAKAPVAPAPKRKTAEPVAELPEAPKARKPVARATKAPTEAPAKVRARK